MNLVEVEYWDLCEHSGKNHEEWKSLGLKRMRKFGYYEEHGDLATVCGEFDVNNDGGDDVIVIPRSLIILVRNLEETFGKVKEK